MVIKERAKPTVNRATFIKNKVTEFWGTFNIKTPLEIKVDNGMGRLVMGVTRRKFTQSKKIFYQLKINVEYMNTNKFSKVYMIHCLVHEIGHIKLHHFGNRGISNVRAEYEAEKFALFYLKLHFPKYYPKALKKIKDFNNGDYNHYRKAYQKLYKELTT